MRVIDVIRNVGKYLDNPKDELELDLAAEYEGVPEKERAKLADRLQSLAGGMRESWFRPTLLDVIRVCREGGVDFLPLEMLQKVDDHDHMKRKRYIESLNESHRFVSDMRRLQSTKGHFAPERWQLLDKDFDIDLDLGYNSYVIVLAKNGSEGEASNVGVNYIFNSGVLFGYDRDDRSLQTVYYIEPCEVVYQLTKGRIVEGDPKKVSMRLLSKCLDNLVQKKAYAGHRDRRQGY